MIEKYFANQNECAQACFQLRCWHGFFFEEVKPCVDQGGEGTQLSA